MDLIYNAGARDEMSGLAKIECYANGKKCGTQEITNKNATGGTVRATGLNPNTTYGDIYVMAYDRAGNTEKTFVTTGTTIGELKTPTVTIENNNAWTKEKTVKITGLEHYSIRYTTNGTNPTLTTGTELTGAGEKTFTIKQNCTVKAVYVTSTNQVGGVGQATTTKIDNVNPTVTIAKGTTTANSVAVTATGTDGQSGVKEYVFQISETGNDNSWTSKPAQTNKAYTYTDLVAGKTYYFRVLVRDNVGNEGISTKINHAMPAEAITVPEIFIANNSNWSASKEVVISKKDGYTIRYTTNGTNPTLTTGTVYSNPFTIPVGTEKKTDWTVKAVYVKDGKVGSVATASTTKIDNKPPTTATLAVVSGTVTSTSVKVRATGADVESGLYMYTFQKSTTNTETGFRDSESYLAVGGTQEHEFTGLTPNTTYYFRVLIVDMCGNESISSHISTTTRRTTARDRNSG